MKAMKLLTQRDVLQDAAWQKHEPICQHELYIKSTRHVAYNPLPFPLILFTYWETHLCFKSSYLCFFFFSSAASALPQGSSWSQWPQPWILNPSVVTHPLFHCCYWTLWPWRTMTQRLQHCQMLQVFPRLWCCKWVSDLLALHPWNVLPLGWETVNRMVAPLCRLHCLLKRAQMLLLCLGIAYLMAGSILLLQRSSTRVAQPNPASLPPLLSLAAPPTALRTAGMGVRARSRWAAVQPVSGGGTKAGQHWPASQSLGVQHFHRRWFHSLLPESPEQRVSLHRSSRHKGKYRPHRSFYEEYFINTTSQLDLSPHLVDTVQSSVLVSILNTLSFNCN